MFNYIEKYKGKTYDGKLDSFNIVKSIQNLNKKHYKNIYYFSELQIKRIYGRI